MTFFLLGSQKLTVNVMNRMGVGGGRSHRKLGIQAHQELDMQEGICPK
jgi:hypothetical protein